MQTSSLISNLFKSFHSNSITYCHWKSNEHLDESFKGNTDFDVLIDENQKDEVMKIFFENGFRLFTPPFNREYQEIEDFIAIDYEQNKIIHFHVHYQLFIGSSGLKEYRYAIENKILATRFYSPIYKCYLIDPIYELILLILRLSLKVRKSWKPTFQKNKEVINSNIELKWLKEKVSFEMLNDLIQKLEMPYNKDDILYIYQNGFQYNLLYSFSLQKENIRHLLIDKPLIKYRKKYFKWLYFQLGRFLRKSGISYVAKQRVKKEDGFSIAILGSDGSGKSTQLIELKSILSKKIDVNTYYLGSNKGSKSQIRKVLEFIRDKNLTLNIIFLQQILTVFLAFSIGFEKKLRLKKANKLKQKGVLILFDRFPQNEIYGYNDGPLLKKMANSDNIILKSIGHLEKKLYTPSDAKYPSIIIKLVADLEVLSNRRNMTIEEINRKQNSILELSFGHRSPIIKIDANKNIEKVTSDILKEIQSFWLANSVSRLE